jgi:hypothetical protein
MSKRLETRIKSPPNSVSKIGISIKNTIPAKIFKGNRANLKGAMKDASALV